MPHPLYSPPQESPRLWIGVLHGLIILAGAAATVMALGYLIRLL